MTGVVVERLVPLIDLSSIVIRLSFILDNVFVLFTSQRKVSLKHARRSA